MPPWACAPGRGSPSPLRLVERTTGDPAAAPPGESSPGARRRRQEVRMVEEKTEGKFAWWIEEMQRPSEKTEGEGDLIN